MLYSPLEQFKIKGFLPFDNSFGIFVTDYVIYLVLTFLSIFILFYLSNYNRFFIPFGIFQVLTEKIYIFIQGVIEQNFTTARVWAEAYFPLFFTIFFFVLFSNLLGLMPYGFTTTSYIVHTFTLSSTLLIGLTIMGVLLQGKEFLNLFIPSGIPVALLPMLVVIEVISYVSKAFSLAIRLFANMMSGHTLLHILSGFVIKICNVSLILALVPFVIVLAISFLELGVSFLQAYVFLILSILYFNDSYKVMPLENKILPYVHKKN